MCVIECGVIDPVKAPSKPPETSQDTLSDEQRFCNDALASREFDTISDEQWVALCEQVALGARQASRDDLATGSGD